MSNHLDPTHRLYGQVRPVLARWGVLKLARQLFSAELRTRVAVRIGLAGFDQTLSSQPSTKTGYFTDEPLARSHSPKLQIKFDGINFIGDMRADLGIGESARLIARAAKKAQIPIGYYEVPLRFQSRTTPLGDVFTDSCNYSFSLFHMNAPEFYEALTLVPSALRKNKYIISFWYWEVPKFPKRWHMILNYLDELWVASHYVQGILSLVAPVPVIRVPLPIQVETTGATRESLGLPENRFIFLFSFNPGSALARKNPYGFIEAFRRAFGQPTGGPLLVIKGQHFDSHYGVGLEQPLREAVESVNGLLLTRNMTRLEMNDLLNASDCYVSLHRSEGFGLGLAEAMALGKPVIATAYSANMDYMTSSNSYGVRYVLRTITEDDHLAQPFFRTLYEPGQSWAEPDIDHAAELMQRIWQDREGAYQTGQQAKSDIATHHNLEVTGKIMAARLQIVVDHLQGNVNTENYKSR